MTLTSPSSIPPEKPPVMRHESGGEHAIRTGPLIDDIAAISILDASQLNGFIACSRFACDLKIDRVASQTHKLPAIGVAPMTQRGDVICRCGTFVPTAPM